MYTFVMEKIITMPVQTFEAMTDDNGAIRLADTIHLPARAKMCIIVPEQTTRCANIVPEADPSAPAARRLPSVRVVDAELAKRLIKTIVVEDAHAEL